MVKKCLPFLVLLLTAAGCTTSTITNLTPKHATRNPSGQYSIEAMLTSRQQTMRWDSIRPQVMVDTNFYPMRKTEMMTNRWETLVPIPAGKSVITYRFKFDFDYNAFGSPPKGDSKLSPVYKLELLEK